MTAVVLLKKLVGMTLWAIVLCLVAVLGLFVFTFVKDYFSRDEFKTTCESGIKSLKEGGYKIAKDGRGIFVYYDHKQLPIASDLLSSRRCYIVESDFKGKFLDGGEVLPIPGFGA